MVMMDLNQESLQMVKKKKNNQELTYKVRLNLCDASIFSNIEYSICGEKNTTLGVFCLMGGFLFSCLLFIFLNTNLDV